MCTKGQKIVFFCFFLGFGQVMQARYLRHMTMFHQEELINNTEFSQSVKSDNGRGEEKFFVNREPVSKDQYYRELEAAQLEQMRKERERLERKKRSRMSFVDQAQFAILEKLLFRLIGDIHHSLELLDHEQLKKYYIFNQKGIGSMDHLAQMRHYVHYKASDELKELAGLMDMQGLQEMLDKLEHWPDHLESLFKDSVQNAIKQSDDTAALKELLALISQ